MARSLAERLEALSCPEPNTGCLLWLGAQNGNGYGLLSIKRDDAARFGRGVRYAHRLAYELSRGEIPEGRILDHRCRVRCCINPGHLEPVTDRENVLRGDGIASRNARKETCKRGHKIDHEDQSPHYRQQGWRRCRECHRQRETARRAVRRQMKEAMHG